MKNNWRVCIAVCAVTLLGACGDKSAQTNTHENSKAQAKSGSQTTAAKETKATSDNPCKFTMGFDVWEPYQYVGFGRKVQGLDIELVDMVVEELNCVVEYKQASWGELLNQLKSGEIDFVSGASMTPERKSFAVFSEPYRSEEFQLYVRADDEHKHRQATVVDFVADGNKVGVIGEYFYGDELTAMMDNAKYSGQFVGTFMGEINVARLLDGDIDGFLEDSFVGASVVRRKGLSSRIVAHQAKLSTGDVYLMFSKKMVKPDTVERFNIALREIKNNGKYDRLLQKYTD